MNRFALHSVPRSGSSWVGAVLSQHPEVNYFFQPLFSTSFPNQLKTNSSFEDIKHFYSQLKTSKDSFINQISFGKENKTKNHNAINVLYKEVRYHHLIQNLLTQDPEIKIIGLVRSPLSTINSWLNAPKEFRKDLNWKELEEWRYAPKKNSNSIEEFNGYEKWKETTLLFEKLQTLYPNRFKLIRYSDLINDSIKSFDNLFRFMNLEMNVKVLSFLSEINSKNDNDAYSIYRKEARDDLWKTQLNPIIIQEIQKDLLNLDLETYLL